MVQWAKNNGKVWGEITLLKAKKEKNQIYLEFSPYLLHIRLQLVALLKIDFRLSVNFPLSRIASHYALE